MSITDVTFEQIIWMAALILLMIGIYNTVMTAVKNHMDAKRRHDAPVDTLVARVDAHDTMLANDKRNIEEMDDRLNLLKIESAMTLKGVRALLSHEINGNSDEKLKESYDNIDNYLINKGG